MKKGLIITILIMGFVCSSEAQKAPIKFGKIDQANLKMAVYDKDTSAVAVVLCDYGRSYFSYNESANRFQVIFEHHSRIKIFNKNGYDWADVSIPFYKDMDRQERVVNIKACTYNLENGKIVKDKLSNSDKLTEETSKYWSKLKFTMPNVKEGSIIEYKYTITSDFVFNFHNWQFQYSIPVKWSEYIAEIPEYYYYNQTKKDMSLFLLMSLMK